MRILALEPYYGGSHRAFLDAWIADSRHQWTLLTLPPYKWKWRMRHGAMTLASEVGERMASGESWQALLCSDMLDLAELRGLAPSGVHALPSVAYFHENQLTYPVRVEKERDLHFGFTNFTTALAASEVWFNSAFHRDEYLGAIARVLKRMPDYQTLEAVARIRAKSRVQPQGIQPLPAREGVRRRGPLRILWAARWEFDKDPDTFFEALEMARTAGVDFRLSVLGEQFKSMPEVFNRARESFADVIDRWGYLPQREDYVAALREADVMVSTARHEFFGVGMVEGIAAGCFPVVPRRLAYPEILHRLEGADDCFYDGSAVALAAKLGELAARRNDLWRGDSERGRRAVARFAWPDLRPKLDDALEAACSL